MSDRAEPLLPALRLALAISLGLLVLRLQLVDVLGFSDSEALFASYALHPQPAYVDHPGLIGSVMRLLGGTGAPSPRATHFVAALSSTLLPWFGALCARLAGAAGAGALRTLIALALIPQLALGLNALSPELLLTGLWLGALGSAALALRSEPGSAQSLYGLLGAGGCAGLAVLADVRGGLLVLVLIVTFAARTARAHLHSFGPWAALTLIVILSGPLVGWELSRGFPLFKQRFITTQLEAWLAMRNVAELLAAQLLYVGPPMLFGAWLLARRVFLHRTTDPVSRLLWNATWLPGALILLFCSWSRSAALHWLAPVYLGLALELGRTRGLGLRLTLASVASGALLCAAGWVWIATDLPIRWLGEHYRARYDVANSSYAWGPGRRLLKEAVETTLVDARRVPVVVGPDWGTCAQAHAALGPAVPVGCNGPRRDDFDDWLPRAYWLDAPVLLYVQDDRHEGRPEAELPNRIVRGVSTVTVSRGGRVIRTLRVTRLDKFSESAARALTPSLHSAAGAQAGTSHAGASASSPAARSRSASSFASGFGVVSSRSP